MKLFTKSIPKALTKRVNYTTLTILFILLLGLFFRIYKLEIFYPFGHDQDLFAWIAKDMVIDHHFRLIGQETSVTGVFIGPLFYYLIALSLAIFNMNPLSANIPTTIFGLLAIFSIYWVFSKFFNKNIGLIGAFLYAVSPGVVFLDRWVVPTQPTILWSVWYLYVLFSILKGNFQILIPLSILIGLIWHVHIAFIPLLALLPISLLLSSKPYRQIRFKSKEIAISGIILMILLSPFIVFEIRHNFQQIKSMLQATQEERGDVKGINRLGKTLDATGKSLAGFFIPNNNALEIPNRTAILFSILFFVLIFASKSTNLLSRNQAIILFGWAIIDLSSQFLSKRSISEYYLNNLQIILVLALSTLIFKIDHLYKKIPLCPILLGLYFITISYMFYTLKEPSGEYLQKRKVVEYIKADSVIKGYPCVAINYIEDQKGLPSGFRYLFWYNNLKIVTSGNDVPVYSIVNPWTISKNEINGLFGGIGVILPNSNKLTANPKICSDPNRQLLPLWGFTN